MSAQNAHDSFFRDVFSHPERLAGLLRAVLPADAVSRLDLNHLTLMPQRYVTESLSDFQTDLVARVPMLGEDQGEDAFVCVLVEHQSRPDRFMALRLLTYCTRIWEQHRREHPERRHLPPVVPVVIYHGERSWAEPRSLHELMPALEGLPNLRPFVPNLTMCLDELTTVSDEALAARPIDTGGRVALSALKHVRDKDLSDRVAAWAAELGAHEAHLPAELRLFVRLVNYLIMAAPSLTEKNMQTMIQTLPEPEREQTGKPLAQRWMEEAAAKGREEGERAVLRRLITRRFGALTPEVEARLGAATTEVLERWADRILDAQSLDEVLE